MTHHTPSTRRRDPVKLLIMAARLDNLADQEIALGNYENALFDWLPDARVDKAVVFRKTAQALRMEARDGQWRCPCCLLTPAERRQRRDPGVMPYLE